MPILQSASVEGFRSLRSVKVPFEDFTSIVGLNNSGKSNLIRALNLFFNDEVEPGLALQLSRDFHRPSKARKQKQRIYVEVEFNLPSIFRFQKALGAIEESLPGRRFRLGKEWSAEHFQPRMFLNGVAVDESRLRAVLQFLKLIHFRYIPNRVHPIDVVRSQRDQFEAMMQRRLSFAKEDQSKLATALAAVASNVGTTISRDLSTRIPSVKSIDIVTPTKLSNVLLELAVTLDEGTGAIEDLFHGSGVQSHLMLQLLLLVDTDFGRHFGWRQATVWAVEEPESSMHFDLEHQTAAFLRNATANSQRFQCIATTHSDAVMQWSDCWILAEKAENGTEMELVDLTKALDRAGAAGITRRVHPILRSTNKPLILVDGSRDTTLVKAALTVLGYSSQVEVASLGELDADSGSGGSELRQYLKYNRSLIAQRKEPVLVLLDWEDKKSGFQTSANLRVVQWNEKRANPLLGQSFRGIERFMPCRIIEAAIKNGAPIGRLSSGGFTVGAADYESAKQKIQAVVREDFGRADCKFMLEDLTSALQEVGVCRTLFA